MAVIYQGICESCDYQTRSFPDRYRGILLDKPVDHHCVHPDHDQILILVHPCESQLREEFGFAKVLPEKEGRLLSFESLFCKTCGLQFEVRRLIAPKMIGCGWLLLVILGVGFLVGYWQDSLWLGTFVVVIVTYLLEQVDRAFGERFLRTKFRERQLEMDTSRRCPECGGEGKKPGGRTVCPNCKQHSFRVKMCAIS